MNNFLNKNNIKENQIKDEIIINNLKCPICNKICLIEINKDKFSITFKCNNNCNYFNKFQNNLICGKSLQKDNSYLNKNEQFCIHHGKFNYHSYCFKCKKNICIKCLKDHEHHQKVDLKLLKPQDNEIFLNKMKVREKFEKISKIIKDIIKWKKEFEDGINSYINAINNIYNIEKFIIMNYNSIHSNNYNYIQNYNHIKKLNINIPELENFEQSEDWKEKGKILMDIFVKNKKYLNENINFRINNIINSNRNNNNNNVRKSPKKNINRFRSHPRKVQKLIEFGREINNNNDKLTIELNEYIEKRKINGNFVGQENEDQNEKKNNNYINNIEMIKLLNIKNIDNNTYESHSTNQNQNSNIKIINNENIITQNDELLNNGRIENITNDNISNKEINYNNLELKSCLSKNKIIKSIEYINDNKILICTLDSLNLYKIDSNFSFEMIYSRNFINDIINYGTKLSNGNYIICFSKSIKIMIIDVEKQLNNNNYFIIQELKPNSNNFNFNKIIEINIKNYLISCGKNHITLYKKNKEKNSYEEDKIIKLEEEIKCIENINEKVFVSINPEKQIITFHDVENFNDNKLNIKDIQTSYGRYNAKNVQKYNTLFIGGIDRIYSISTEKYELNFFYKTGEWISSIDYDDRNNSIICGTYEKLNNKKNYNIIIYSNEIEKIQVNYSNKYNMIEKVKKNNSHQSDIMVVKYSQNGYIITGSNDKNIKVWN